MALVSLDTMVMAWALRKTASPGQEYRLVEAVKLLQWIEEEKHKIVLTATAVGEYLVGLDDVQRKAELGRLQKNFHILPYDAPAEFAGVVERDEVLAAETLKMANSIMFCGSRPVMNLHQAVVRNAAWPMPPVASLRSRPR